MSALDTAVDAPPGRLRLWLPPLLAALAALALYATGADRQLFLLVNGWSGLTGPGLWAHLTILGDALVVITLTLPLVGRRPDLLWSMIWAAALCGLAVTGLKELLNTPRPPSVIDPALIRVIGEPVWSFSFPSGHSAAAVTLAGLFRFAPRIPAVVVPVAAAGALLVAISRMVVGVHWPVDVLGGAAVGWLCAAGGMAIAARLPGGMRPTGQRIVALLLVGCAIALLFHKTGYPQALLFQRLIAAGALAAAVPGLRRLFLPTRTFA